MNFILSVQDLSKLNRDPKRVIYVSGHALESCLQPENCVEIKPWKGDDVNDTTLLDLLPFLECEYVYALLYIVSVCFAYWPNVFLLWL